MQILHSLSLSPITDTSVASGESQHNNRSDSIDMPQRTSMFIGNAYKSDCEADDDIWNNSTTTTTTAENEFPIANALSTMHDTNMLTSSSSSSASASSSSVAAAAAATSNMMLLSMVQSMPFFVFPQIAAVAAAAAAAEMTNQQTTSAASTSLPSINQQSISAQSTSSGNDFSIDSILATHRRTLHSSYASTPLTTSAPKYAIHPLHSWHDGDSSSSIVQASYNLSYNSNCSNSNNKNVCIDEETKAKLLPNQSNPHSYHNNQAQFAYNRINYHRDHHHHHNQLYYRPPQTTHFNNTIFCNKHKVINPKNATGEFIHDERRVHANDIFSSQKQQSFQRSNISSENGFSSLESSISIKKIKIEKESTLKCNVMLPNENTNHLDQNDITSDEDGSRTLQPDNLDIATTGNCGGKNKRAKNINRGPRIPFTASQVSELESKFAATQYLSSLEVNQLAQRLKLTDNRIRIWFQNRRAREKREHRLPSTTRINTTIASAATAETSAATDLEKNSDTSNSLAIKITTIRTSKMDALIMPPIIKINQNESPCADDCYSNNCSPCSSSNSNIINCNH